MKKRKKIKIFAVILAVFVFGGIFLFLKLNKKENQNLPQTTSPLLPQPTIKEEKLPEGFDYEEKTGGKLGGFFFLKDINWGKHEDFERVTITVIPQDKNPLPYYKVSLKENSKDSLPGSENVAVDQDLLRELGQFRLEVYISDISAYDISQTIPKQVYTKGDLDIQSEFINKIKVYYPKEDNTIVILIGLKNKIPFKTFTLQNPSRIVVDLKK